MQSKKILILGAGVYQVPLIRRAKELGYNTIVSSIEGNYPGLSLADKVYYIDTMDAERVLQLAREEKIDGICTTGTDVAITTIGYVCDSLGLNGLSQNAAKIATNKMLMKTAYEEHDVRTARFRKVFLNHPDIAAQVKDLHFPLIFKATDTSGSRGIVRVESASEFEYALKISAGATKLDYIIVEEFLTGIEFGAQAMVSGGELKFVLPHGDYVFHGDTGVPIGHYAPYDMSEELVKDTYEQIKKAIAAMGLDNCAINADFILCDDNIYVLELGARGGATCLCELVSICYGINYYEKILDLALGIDPDIVIPKSPAPNASKLLYSDHGGTIKEIDMGTSTDANVVETAVYNKIGDKVCQFRTGADRIGHVITKGDTVQEAEALLAETISRIRIVIE